MTTGGSPEFDVRSNLRPLIQDMKAISPKLATGFRKSLRETGNAIIERQQEILRTEPVGGVVTSTRYSLAQRNRRGGYRRGPRARELGGARIVSVDSRASSRERGRGLRASVAANLTTRVSTPASGRGASVRVASRTPAWSNKALNAKKWRHPVFGRPERIEQAGNQYFQRGAKAGVIEARAALLALVEDAAKSIKTHDVQ
jgi:hypothetical protein